MFILERKASPTNAPRSLLTAMAFVVAMAKKKPTRLKCEPYGR